MSDLTVTESRELARKQRAELTASKAALAEQVRDMTKRLHEAAKHATPLEASKLRQQIRDNKEAARLIKADLDKRLAAVRETHQTLKANTQTEIDARRNERKSERASVIKTPKHTYDVMGNRHKLDTPNTLLAKEATRKLALDIAYNEFAYYPHDTLFLQLSDHTKIFITDGFGVVSKAQEEIENIPNRKNFPDYAIIASIIYPAALSLQTARQKDKAEIKLDFCLDEYLLFLSNTAIEALSSGDYMASAWCIMAATGCRANELLTSWQSVDEHYIKYESPKVSLTSNNVTVSLLPTDVIEKLRTNIICLDRETLARIIATQHDEFIQKFPKFVGKPPRFTRDIYQCLCYKTMLKYGDITAMQFTNYVSHRTLQSSTFLAYVGLNLHADISIQSFVDLAKMLHFI